MTHPPGYPVGTRVRLVAPVEYYPLGIWPIGTTGTVTACTPEAHPAGLVRLDGHFAALEDWDNQIQVCSPAELDSATWAAWEAIP
jgi:hypothetical protein